MRRLPGLLHLPVLLPAWAWLLVFVAAPSGLILAMALATPAESVPPFAWGLNPAAFADIAADDLAWRGVWGSLVAGAVASVGCLLIGYPMALAIARAPARRRSFLLLLVMLPFWTGFLPRITAWIGLLRDGGLLDRAFAAVGLAPLGLLHTDFAMHLGMIYAYLPFMVLPVQARLAAADPALEQAAADLGASPWRCFWRVTWPLSLPGVWAGLALVFVPVTGEVVIPDLLGGPASLTLGRVIWDEFFQNHDWPRAAALSAVLLAALVGPSLVVRRA